MTYPWSRLLSILIFKYVIDWSVCANSWNPFSSADLPKKKCREQCCHGDMAVLLSFTTSLDLPLQPHC